MNKMNRELSIIPKKKSALFLQILVDFPFIQLARIT